MPAINFRSNGPIGIILLAAGAARRFGRNKLQEPIGGRPLIDWTIEAAAASGLRPLLVVVRPAQTLAVESVMVVVNPHPEDGLSSSVRCGLSAATEQNWLAAILTPTDQPLLSSEVFCRLADAFHNGAELAVATYHGQPRNPVMLARSRWPEAMSLIGDTGLSAMARSPSATRIECSDIASIGDVDTPADIAAIERQLASTQ